MGMAWLRLDTLSLKTFSNDLAVCLDVHSLDFIALEKLSPILYEVFIRCKSMNILLGDEAYVPGVLFQRTSYAEPFS